MNILMRAIVFFKPKSSRQIAEEFIGAFPDKCMICSLHNFGVSNGLARGLVKNHKCIDDV